MWVGYAAAMAAAVRGAEAMPAANSGHDLPADDEGNVECPNCGRRFAQGVLHDGMACSNASAHNRKATDIALQVGGQVVMSTEGVPIVIFPEDELVNA